MKLNNKILAGIFALLIAVFVFQKFIKTPTNRSFKAVLVEVDTSQVDKMILTNKSNPPVSLIKEEGQWRVESAEGKSYPALNSAIRPLLTAAAGISTQQLVSRSEDKHTEYELDDASGKKLELYNDGKLLGAFYVGRFNFDQASRTAKSYVRESASPDIYSVDGFLAMSMDRKADDFRDKKLLPGFTPGNIESIDISADDFSSRLEKSLDNQWLNQEDLVIDSTRMDSYLKGVQTAQGIVFSTEEARDAVRLGEIVFHGPGAETLHKVELLRNPSNEFIVRNSDIAEQSFVSDSTGLFAKVYLELKGILQEEG